MVRAGFLQPPGRALGLEYSSPAMQRVLCLPGKDEPPHPLIELEEFLAGPQSLRTWSRSFSIPSTEKQGESRTTQGLWRRLDFCTALHYSASS